MYIYIYYKDELPTAVPTFWKAPFFCLLIFSKRPSSLQHRCGNSGYLPGQTLCIQAKQDQSSPHDWCGKREDPNGNDINGKYMLKTITKKTHPCLSGFCKWLSNGLWFLNNFYPQVDFQKNPSTLPETNIAPENRPSQKEISSSNHPFSGANLLLVSGSVSTHGCIPTEKNHPLRVKFPSWD